MVKSRQTPEEPPPTGDRGKGPTPAPGTRVRIGYLFSGPDVNLLGVPISFKFLLGRNPAFAGGRRTGLQAAYQSSCLRGEGFPPPAGPILLPGSGRAGERKNSFTLGIKNAYDSLKVERRSPASALFRAPPEEIPSFLRAVHFRHDSLCPLREPGAHADLQTQRRERADPGE